MSRGKWDEADKARVLEVVKGTCNGRLNARPRRQIAEMTNVTQRQLREMVRELNKEGEPIMPSNTGYYYCTNPDEISRVESRYRAMGVANIAHANYIKDIADRLRDRQARIQGMAYPVKDEKMIII